MCLLRKGKSEDYAEDEITVKIPADIVDHYINDSYVKTICEAKNLHHLKNAAIKELSVLNYLLYEIFEDLFIHF